VIPRIPLPRKLPRVPPEHAPKRPVPPPVQCVDDTPDSDPVPPSAPSDPGEPGPPDFDVMVGANGRTPQYGLLGSADGRRVALNLNGCDTISLFGVQGFGKSYTLGVVAEMAAMAVPKINHLPSPLGVVLFHYHRSDNYEPEQATATAPNDNPSEVDRLIREYGASPAGLKDVVILAPESKVRDRQLEYPDIDVRPLKFASSEIGPEGWKFLLGVAGGPHYVRMMLDMMRKQVGHPTIERLREDVKMAGFEPNIQRLAESRLNLAERYIDDSCRLEDTLRPGRTVIVDLRDEWIEKEDALGLFVVILRIFERTMYRGEPFSKLIVFDEAHKYITDSKLIGEVVEAIRQIRHEQNTIVIASQDPLSVPRAVIELSTILVLHRMTSPAWVKHLRDTTEALKKGLDVAMLARLNPGEALVWCQRSSDIRFTTKPQLVRIRPRFTQHGGGTKTAVR